jgi:excisionase family DNA binding protein
MLGVYGLATTTGGTLMRTSPVNVVDPTELADDERDRLGHLADDVARTGTIDLAALPIAVREQLRFALDAYARGETVSAVATGKPLTSNEAAKLLGMSRSHLARLCDEGRIECFTVGNALRISADEVMRILTERGRAKTEARAAAATADERRRARAARAAGLK